MEIASLTNFVTWQKAVRLAADVIKLSQRTSLSRHLWACDQLRRAALSVPSNIAEGYERRAEKDADRFYLIAKGSCAEVLTQIKVAQLADLLSQQEADPILAPCEENPPLDRRSPQSASPCTRLLCVRVTTLAR